MKRIFLFLVLALVVIILSGCTASYFDDKIPIDGFQETQFTSSLTINKITHSINIVKDPNGYYWYAIEAKNECDRQLIPVLSKDGRNATSIQTTSSFEPIENHKVSIGEFQVTAYKSNYTVDGKSYKAVIVRDPIGFLWYATESSDAQDWELSPILTKGGEYATEIPAE